MPVTYFVNQSTLDLMDVPNEPAALLSLIAAHAKSGDTGALRALATELERRAEKSGELAYLASLAHELFDSPARQRFLRRSAELGFPAAQLDIAANFALGLNGFPRDIAQYEQWIGVAEKVAPSDAAALRSRVAHEV